MNQMDGIGMKKPRPLRYRGGKGEQVTLIGELHSIIKAEEVGFRFLRVHALGHICIPPAEIGCKTNDSVASQTCIKVWIDNFVNHINSLIARREEAGGPEKLAFYSGS